MHMGTKKEIGKPGGTQAAWTGPTQKMEARVKRPRQQDSCPGQILKQDTLRLFVHAGEQLD